MVVGNVVGSRMADKALMPTVGKVLLWSIVVMVLFVPAAHHPVTAALATFFLGTLVAIGPALQIRLMDVAGDAQTLAAALNHSAFNAANALGAWLGGVGIAAGLGWTSTGWMGWPSAAITVSFRPGMRTSKKVIAAALTKRRRMRSPPRKSTLSG